MKKSTMLQLAGGLALAGAGLYIFLRDVDPVQLGNDLKETPVWTITACVLLTVLTLWLRAVRWNLILPKSTGADRGGLFGIVMIGFMVNNFLPARLGEATRMVLLWKRNRFTIAQSVGSVLLERIIDSVFFLSFFFVPALLLPGLRSVIPYAMPMAIFSGGVVLLLLLYLLFPSGMMRGFDKCCAILPHRVGERVRGGGRDLVSNVHWLFNPWKCLVMIVISFATVFCHPVMMMILIGTKGFGVLDGLFCSACAAIGAAIPLSPGYVGTLHAALKQGFILCGIGSSKAIAVATIYHAIGYVTVTVLGLWYFFRMKITFKDITRAKETVDQEKDVEHMVPRVGS